MNVVLAVLILLMLFAVRFLLPVALMMLFGRITNRFAKLD